MPDVMPVRISIPSGGRWCAGRVRTPGSEAIVSCRLLLAPVAIAPPPWCFRQLRWCGDTASRMVRGHSFSVGSFQPPNNVLCPRSGGVPDPVLEWLVLLSNRLWTSDSMSEEVCSFAHFKGH